jgi:hypothetical protein
MEYLESLSIFPYCLSVVIITWITIEIFWVYEKPSQKAKLITALIWGILLGIIWAFFVKPQIDLLILGFFASAGFYDYIIKHILSKFRKF